MRHSSIFFRKTALTSMASMLVLSSCVANTPARQGADPYDSYYGQPQPQSSYVDQDGRLQVIVNPAAPKTYVVQKGDTLWGIARKFLNTPWYWPEIWDKNQRIQNPHLIYPGDVLTMEYRPGRSGSGNKLVPRIRIERRGSGEPLSTLTPFMAWPRVLDEATIKYAPYILASRDDHILIGEGETVYVERLRNSRPGARCAIYNPGKPLYEPASGQLLGYEVAYAGYSRIERVGNPSTATILSSKREVRKGDRLFVPVDETVKLNVPIRAPGFKVRADVISLFDAEYNSGNYMAVTLNKGRRDRLQAGHVLGVYTAGRHVVDTVKSCDTGTVCSELPPEKVANVIIYKVNERISYGLIMDATREVRNGDKIGNP